MTVVTWWKKTCPEIDEQTSLIARTPKFVFGPDLIVCKSETSAITCFQ